MKLYIFNIVFEGGITATSERLFIFADSQDIADVKTCQEMKRNPKFKEALQQMSQYDDHNDHFHQDIAFGISLLLCCRGRYHSLRLPLHRQRRS